ncbi:MAG: GatB/YqeY domain-containing protein [Patescibacteria group bacterium]
MTKQQLRDEMTKSMLAKDALKTSVLRMLVSALNYYEIQKGGAGYEASDEDVLAVIQKEVKQRHDSIEQFNNAGRKELAEKEQKELTILQAYLPAQMSEDEVKKLVLEAIVTTGATTVSDMGKVMGALMPKIKGKADGNLVSRLVKETLLK